MVRKLSVIAVCAIGLAGCSTIRGTRTAVPQPPSGPIQATTTSPGVIPEGTSMAVRTNEGITSRQAGQTFSAQVAQDIEDQTGKTLVPKGSPAELTITEVGSGGAVGTKSIALALRSVTINGKRFNVQTADEVQRGGEGLGANRRTATMVGGGAVLGTLLGAVIGGGGGAAAGAAVGAAGGAAAQVLTRGDEVRVPAETVLTFRLDQPLRLTS